MPLHLAHQERRLYENNPIKLVICQLKFPILFEYERPEALAPAQRVLSGTYPRHEQEQQLGFAVGPQGALTVPPTAQWRFRQGSDGWSVVLGRDFVSLEATAYNRFEEFDERLAQALDALAALGVTQRDRLGLRYVNEIRVPDGTGPTAWRSYLNEELLGMVGGDVLGEDVIHAVQEIRLREALGVLVVKHGYVGPEPTGGDPHYILDLDMFSDQPVPLDAPEVLATVRTFHETIKDVFEMSITDALRDHLVVREVINA